MSVNHVRAYVDNYQDGDPVAAIRAIIDVYSSDYPGLGAGVLIIDRDRLEAHLGRDLTETEWGVMGWRLDTFGDWIANSGAAESIDTFIADTLAFVPVACEHPGCTALCASDKRGGPYVHVTDEGVARFCDHEPAPAF